MLLLLFAGPDAKAYFTPVREKLPSSIGMLARRQGFSLLFP
jgi:hypothetical protein